MSELVCSLPEYQHFIIILLVALFELYLGKTTKLKSASILELIFNIIVSMTRLSKKKE